jgi:hypothetical protein
MKDFLERFGSEVNGVVSGWDRLAVRGTIRWLASVRGVLSYMHHIVCCSRTSRAGPRH